MQIQSPFIGKLLCFAGSLQAPKLGIREFHDDLLVFFQRVCWYFPRYQQKYQQMGERYRGLLGLRGRGQKGKSEAPQGVRYLVGLSEILIWWVVR